MWVWEGGACNKLVETMKFMIKRKTFPVSLISFMAALMKKCNVRIIHVCFGNLLLPCTTTQKVVNELIRWILQKHPARVKSGRARVIGKCCKLWKCDTSKALSDSGEVNKGRAQHFPVWSKLAAPWFISNGVEAAHQIFGNDWFMRILSFNFYENWKMTV